MPDPPRSDARIEAVLSQLSHAANLGISPEELLKRAMDGLLQVTRAPAGLACLTDPEGKTLEVVSIRGIRPAAVRALPQAFRLEVERGSEYVTRPIRIGEETFPGLEKLQASFSAEGIGGGILLPLSRDGRLLGLLMAMFRAGGETLPLPDAVLETLQRQLSTALQNARVRQGLQSTNTDLLRLLTLAKILAEPRDLEDTLTMVAQAAKSFSGAVATAVWLTDPVAKSLRRIVLLAPEGPERFSPTQFAYGEGIAGWVAANGEVLHVEDPLTDPRVVAKRWAQSLGIRSFYGFPLRFGDALVGVLSVGTSAPLPAPQISLFGTFCDHAALAIGQADLLRTQEVHAEQLGSLVGVAEAVNAGRPRGAVLGMIAEACRRATGATSFVVWRAEGKTGSSRSFTPIRRRARRPFGRAASAMARGSPAGPRFTGARGARPTSARPPPPATSTGTRTAGSEPAPRCPFSPPGSSSACWSSGPRRPWPRSSSAWPRGTRPSRRLAWRVRPERLEPDPDDRDSRSEEHTSELQSRLHLLC